jgi:putative Holliday junction resolvase
VSPAGRVLAIDYGEKRIGLALSDPLRLFAKPLKVIPNNGFESVIGEIAGVIREYSVGLALVGMPYAIEGGDTPKTLETKKFLRRAIDRLDIPVRAWDERYTTDEAVKELIKMDYGWKERRGIQDAMAAAMILKSYLETSDTGNDI